MQGFLKFVAGSALGVALGAAVAALVAPSSGEQLQSDTKAFVDHVKSEGDLARKQAEEQAAQRFRARVGDTSALTPTP
jgi:gas vesicle protein